jgi:hypothetical protein
MNEVSSGRPYAISIELAHAPESPTPRAAPRRRAPGPFLAGLLDPYRGFILPPKISVSIEGHPFGIPDDALASNSDSLGELLEACYLFGDWRRVHALSWQLRWIAPALKDERACAEALSESPPSGDILGAAFGLRDAYKQFPYGTQTLNLPGSKPPQWAVTLVQYLRSSAGAPFDLTPNPAQRAAVIPHVGAVSRAYDAAIVAFRTHVRDELERIEDQAQKQALQQLADARTTILNQGWRLLGFKDERTFEDWSGLGSAHLANWSDAPTQDLKDLTDVVNELAPLGEAVLEADFAIDLEILEGAAQALGHAAAQGGEPALQLAVLMIKLYAAVQSSRVAELRTKLVEAQMRLAKRLASATVRFPILFRFSPNELSNLRRSPRPATVTEMSAEAELGLHIYGKLRKALDANADMKQRLEATQPIAKARTASDGHVALHDQGLARQCLDSVWAYPKIVTEALERLYVPPGAVARVASERLLKDVAHAKDDKERGWQAVMIFEGLISLPLSIVCPPAGLALDLAFGLADSVLSTGAYLRQGDEYFCALDPVQAFAEIEPSALPIVLSIGGVLLSGFTGVKARG